MTIPTISRYAESVLQPFGLFRTLNNIICERDVYGDPIIISGGNAAVFKVWSAGKPYALKCYTKLKQSPTHIYRKLREIESPLLFKTKYLPGEIYVFGMDGEGGWHDVAFSEWADGETLEYEIRKALHYGKSDMFAGLAKAFDAMVVELLSQPWAHGDLKPGNISVDSNGAMKLFDYDAMFFPELECETASETGTPQYQHPLRTPECFGKFIDDYSIALISATLHSLAAMPEAYQRYGSKDIFLFHPYEILEHKSAGHKAMKEYAAQKGNAYLYRMLVMLESPAPNIDRLRELISYGSLSANDSRPSNCCEPFVANGAWGYAAGDNIVIPPVYDNALSFSDELAIVELGGYRHFIDNCGKIAIDCSGYEQIKPFSHGAAAVKQNGVWGYMGTDGRLLIRPRYQSAETFRDGKAVVTTPAGRKNTLEITEVFKKTHTVKSK